MCLYVYVHVLCVCMDALCIVIFEYRFVCVQCMCMPSLSNNVTLRSDGKINIITIFGVMIRSI